MIVKKIFFNFFVKLRTTKFLVVISMYWHNDLWVKQVPNKMFILSDEIILLL